MLELLQMRDGATVDLIWSHSEDSENSGGEAIVCSGVRCGMAGP